MFETLTPAPPDAILGLTEAFRNDRNPRKINLGVGVYKDAAGKTPILASVKLAEQRVLASEQSKTYLAIDGLPAYNTATQSLIFGQDHEIVRSGRAATAQAPGGTGALRVAADFLAHVKPGATVWLSDPTWPNHPSIFRAAGLEVRTYPYFDAATNSVDFSAMLTAIAAIPEGDVIVLHGCCHNPTGVDLSLDQWRQIASAVEARRLLPLVDFAYQGFAAGLAEDAAGVLAMARPQSELLVAKLILEEFWPLQRACRRAHRRRCIGVCRAGSHEPRQAGNPRQLLQPAGARRHDRQHRARRP